MQQGLSAANSHKYLGKITLGSKEFRMHVLFAVLLLYQEKSLAKLFARLAISQSVKFTGAVFTVI